MNDGHSKQVTTAFHKVGMSILGLNKVDTQNMLKNKNYGGKKTIFVY